MGKTGARLKELERKIDNIHKQAINSIGESVHRINEGNKIRNAVLRELTERLIVAEGLLQSVLNDIIILKQSNLDYQIKLLSKNLDDAQAIINKLENTAWRKFCRWIRLLFTV